MNKKLVVLLFLAALLLSCGGSAIESDAVFRTGAATYYYMKIDGMDCIYMSVGGSGNSGFTCDWDNWKGVPDPAPEGSAPVGTSSSDAYNQIEINPSTGNPSMKFGSSNVGIDLGTGEVGPAFP